MRPNSDDALVLVRISKTYGGTGNHFYKTVPQNNWRFLLPWLTINISIKINNGAPFDPWKICVFKLLQSFQCWIVPANKRKYMYSQKSILIKTIHWPQKIHISKLSTYTRREVANLLFFIWSLSFAYISNTAREIHQTCFWLKSLKIHSLNQM